jgi:hypothetical protein
MAERSDLSQDTTHGAIAGAQTALVRKSHEAVCLRHRLPLAGDPVRVCGR